MGYRAIPPTSTFGEETAASPFSRAADRPGCFRWRLVLPILALIGLLSLAALSGRPIGGLTVGSASMEPTLHCANAPGCLRTRASRLVVSGIPYLFTGPRRGDIVVINLTHELHACGGAMVVKRIVGLPGETVTQVGGTVLVDGRRLIESYLPEDAQQGHGFSTLQLPAGAYFVMGDNRGHSCDSRNFGPVPRRLITAKVIATY